MGVVASFIQSSLICIIMISSFLYCIRFISTFHQVGVMAIVWCNGIRSERSNTIICTLMHYITAIHCIL